MICCSRRAIGARRSRRRIDLFAKHDVLGFGGRPDRFERGVDRWRDRDIRHVQADAAGGNPRHVEQFFDHLRLDARIALDHSDRVADARPILIGPREDRGPAQNGVQAACAARATAWRGNRPSCGWPLRPACAALCSRRTRSRIDVAMFESVSASWRTSEAPATGTGASRLPSASAARRRRQSFDRPASPARRRSPTRRRRSGRARRPHTPTSIRAAAAATSYRRTVTLATMHAAGDG